ncbi:D-sedoheptulose 7-phosphate isomerase [Aquabacterium sp. A7-Y]|uniref:D-sedoheptulose-7-phosphate isomerase n=1 Tax=Aquabacterium sp. A7-Y TaxID=1349605 RepID=UPI00223D7CA9|nr:D-sedoheptulose 7-phosphate isomerase [Aquabacterium sp. A7-Y]MCW7536284.1 D-sedoheptulose 7-phosphate isomerase [Aquabacterium sp. A7-Y]
MSSLFLRNLEAQIGLLQQLQSLDEVVGRAGVLAARTLGAGGRLFFCGNGGSAADSQHMASELTGRFVKERKPLAAVALTTDTSALTSIGNDYAFEEVFARQLAGLARAGDCLVGISTSGHSKNVVRAVATARELGVHTIGLLGRDGGQLKDMCDVAIVVPSQVTARIQETHILIGHTLCGLIEEGLGLV